MKQLLIIILLLWSSVYAQGFKVIKLTGKAETRIGAEEKWNVVKPGDNLDMNSFVATGANSELQLGNDKINFTLKETSAIELKSLKKLSLDELLLALAMEDMINAPKHKKKNNSKNTAVYGTKETNETSGTLLNDFGVKRLNGAVQLAENGFKESAIITAKETFRKYPETNSLPFYRIYFADLLVEKGLYKEALEDYSAIKILNLDKDDKVKVDETLALLNRKLGN